MFKFLLVVLLTGQSPQPVALFTHPAMCQYMAAVINKSDIDGRAICVETIEHEDT